MKTLTPNDPNWQFQATDNINLLGRLVGGKGATSARPESPTNGQMFYDNTLKIPVWWNTEDGEWKDASGAAA